MKTRFLSSIYLCHIFLICCTLFMDLRAQDFEQENTKVMERMDTESFKGKVLLNKAIALDYQLEPFRTREKDKEGAYVTHLDAMLLRQLIETAERGDMDGRKKTGLAKAPTCSR